MSAPIAPMTHVTNGWVRPSSVTAKKVAFETNTAAARARATCHPGARGGGVTAPTWGGHDRRSRR